GISSPCDSCTPTIQYSASIVSFLPDGTDVQVYADGIRAAVGLAYYPGTDTLFVTMNQRDDLGDATPGDWLSVVQQGQSRGFPDCYGQGGETCAAEPTPVAVLDTHAAVSGLAIVTDQLGDAVGTTALVAEWATGKVLSLAVDAASLASASTATDFLIGFTSPEPVVTGPDGAVYVGDWTTGIVYRIDASA
ncbi:MAG: putative rane-bound dehydrogenase oxidoreductase protein, partial [Ilumatobacteraceae bacterium]|nr:putative rane-bound dehydrogenase oxidoreductase protein [Ilumatobacteraceae bacterium]